ncbi:MAG: sigma-54-dependent transcriptional regulator [Candidatus Polarisedimenticolia bacterium]
MPEARARILIADDEPVARQMLGQILADEGHDVVLAPDGIEALHLVEQFPPDLLLTDLRMPGLDGYGLLLKVRQAHPRLPVVIMTAQGTIRSAVDALRAGAFDYLTKPVPLEDLARVVRRAVSANETVDIPAGVEPFLPLDGIVGRSPAMREVARLARQIAPTQATILITGESGTGKDVLAQAIHELSPRAACPFVKVSCAALSETLLESELFGHERGAFTGAVMRRPGRFEIAAGGTIFLDEIGDMTASMQVKLLRFLQERRFERVGGNQTLSVDARVIAATHRNLDGLVQEGTFREDLYWRLKVIELTVPPLRARPQDIPLLADHFAARFARANHKTLDGLTGEAIARLLAYPWPGNVRELENAIERAVVLARGRRLGAELFASSADKAAGGPTIPGSSLEEIEKEAILRTLEAVGGSSIRAAAILRISPRTIQYKRKQWGGTAGTTESASRVARPQAG